MIHSSVPTTHTKWTPGVPQVRNGFDSRYRRVRLSLVYDTKPAFYDSVVQLVVRTPSIPRRRSGVQIPFESLKAEKKLLYLKRVCILFVGSHTICFEEVSIKSQKPKRSEEEPRGNPNSQPLATTGQPLVTS